jgi:hypothetical protein
MTESGYVIWSPWWWRSGKEQQAMALHAEGCDGKVWNSVFDVVNEPYREQVKELGLNFKHPNCDLYIDSYLCSCPGTPRANSRRRHIA